MLIASTTYKNVHTSDDEMQSDYQERRSDKRDVILDILSDIKTSQIQNMSELIKKNKEPVTKPSLLKCEDFIVPIAQPVQPKFYNKAVPTDKPDTRPKQSNISIKELFLETTKDIGKKFKQKLVSLPDLEKIFTLPTQGIKIDTNYLSKFAKYINDFLLLVTNEQNADRNKKEYASVLDKAKNKYYSMLLENQLITINQNESSQNNDNPSVVKCQSILLGYVIFAVVACIAKLQDDNYRNNNNNYNIDSVIDNSAFSCYQLAQTIYTVICEDDNSVSGMQIVLRLLQLINSTNTSNYTHLLLSALHLVATIADNFTFDTNSQNKNPKHKPIDLILALFEIIRCFNLNQDESLVNTLIALTVKIGSFFTNSSLQQKVLMFFPEAAFMRNYISHPIWAIHHAIKALFTTNLTVEQIHQGIAAMQLTLFCTNENTSNYVKSIYLNEITKTVLKNIIGNNHSTVDEYSKNVRSELLQKAAQLTKDKKQKEITEQYLLTEKIMDYIRSIVKITPNPELNTMIAKDILVPLQAGINNMLEIAKMLHFDYQKRYNDVQSSLDNYNMNNNYSAEENAETRTKNKVENYKKDKKDLEKIEQHEVKLKTFIYNKLLDIVQTDQGARQTKNDPSFTNFKNFLDTLTLKKVIPSKKTKPSNDAQTKPSNDAQYRQLSQQILECILAHCTTQNLQILNQNKNKLSSTINESNDMYNKIKTDITKTLQKELKLQNDNTVIAAQIADFTFEYLKKHADDYINEQTIFEKYQLTLTSEKTLTGEITIKSREKGEITIKSREKAIEYLTELINEKKITKIDKQLNNIEKSFKSLSNEIMSLLFKYANVTFNEAQNNDKRLQASIATKNIDLALGLNHISLCDISVSGIPVAIYDLNTVTGNYAKKGSIAAQGFVNFVNHANFAAILSKYNQTTPDILGVVYKEWSVVIMDFIQSNDATIMFDRFIKNQPNWSFPKQIADMILDVLMAYFHSTNVGTSNIGFLNAIMAIPDSLKYINTISKFCEKAYPATLDHKSTNYVLSNKNIASPIMQNIRKCYTNMSSVSEMYSLIADIHETNFVMTAGFALMEQDRLRKLFEQQREFYPTELVDMNNDKDKYEEHPQKYTTNRIFDNDLQHLVLFGTIDSASAHEKEDNTNNEYNKVITSLMESATDGKYSNLDTKEKMMAVCVWLNNFSAIAHAPRSSIGNWISKEWETKYASSMLDFVDILQRISDALFTGQQDLQQDTVINRLNKISITVGTQLFAKTANALLNKTYDLFVGFPNSLPSVIKQAIESSSAEYTQNTSELQSIVQAGKYMQQVVKNNPGICSNIIMALKELISYKPAQNNNRASVMDFVSNIASVANLMVRSTNSKVQTEKYAALTAFITEEPNAYFFELHSKPKLDFKTVFLQTQIIQEYVLKLQEQSEKINKIHSSDASNQNPNKLAMALSTLIEQKLKLNQQISLYTRVEYGGYFISTPVRVISGNISIPQSTILPVSSGTINQYIYNDINSTSHGSASKLMLQLKNIMHRSASGINNMLERFSQPQTWFFNNDTFELQDCKLFNPSWYIEPLTDSKKLVQQLLRDKSGNTSIITGHLLNQQLQHIQAAVQYIKNDLDNTLFDLFQTNKTLRSSADTSGTPHQHSNIFRALAEYIRISPAKIIECLITICDTQSMNTIKTHQNTGEYDYNLDLELSKLSISELELNVGVDIDKNTLLIRMIVAITEQCHGQTVEFAITEPTQCLTTQYLARFIQSLTKSSSSADQSMLCTPGTTAITELIASPETKSKIISALQYWNKYQMRNEIVIHNSVIAEDNQVKDSRIVTDKDRSDPRVALANIAVKHLTQRDGLFEPPTTNHNDITTKYTQQADITEKNDLTTVHKLGVTAKNLANTATVHQIAQFALGIGIVYVLHKAANSLTHPSADMNFEYTNDVVELEYSSEDEMADVICTHSEYEDVKGIAVQC
jgi:hypothetical protein